jgi:hypothetical protein
VLRANVRYAESRPDLMVDAISPATPTEPSRGGWRRWLGPALYAVLILFGVFLFPRLAVVGYLLVAVRGVFVVGSEGRLSLSFGWMVPKRWSRS